LGETVSGGQSIIHVDLNLENVLVGPGGFVWLIDFAETREGHAVFDAARLLVEVIAHVVAPAVADVERFRALLVSALDTGSCPDPALAKLVASLIQTGRRCQSEPARTREYDLAAAVAALGALKFDNLAPHARACLYLTAAAVARRL
jgi:Ser/Thr protein kinase RdoA (MazF antagonist)